MTRRLPSLPVFMFTEVPEAGLDIRVPASIANLGPGFDTLAVAVRLYLHLHVTPVEGRNKLHFEFPDCQVDGENYVERAFRFVARQQSEPFPSLRVVVRTDIPMKSGLGSSAAATVAGLRLYEAIAGPLPPHGLLNAACALEGHPDNVAAALLGGLTISCQLPDRSAFAVRQAWPDSLGILVLTPHFPLSTASSRGLCRTWSHGKMQCSISSAPAFCFAPYKPEISHCCGRHFRTGFISHTGKS